MKPPTFTAALPTTPISSQPGWRFISGHKFAIFPHLNAPTRRFLTLLTTCDQVVCRYRGLTSGAVLALIMKQAAAPDFSGYGALVTALFKDQDYNLGFEPGRSIIANNGVLLTRVIRVKKGDGKRFVITDAAMNDLLRPTLYEAYHKIVPVAAPGTPAGPADIVGPICETGDYLGLDRDLPEIASGAQLAVLSAGAYGAVMASYYNSRSPAAEVLVHDSTPHLLRAARPIEELIADESTPNFISIDGR